MYNKINEQSINRLDINDVALNILKESNTLNIRKLCGKSKTELKDMNLSTKNIKKIEIELQLLGLNLRNNNY